VRESFPLPGRYHFRFKSPLVPGGDHEKGAMAVWMDCVHDSQMIPTWQNSIIAKVARVAVEEEDDDDDDFGTPAPAPVPPKQQTGTAPPPPPRHMESSEPLLDVFDSTPTPSGSSPSSLHGSAHNSTADLLNASAHAPIPTSSSASLLDMDGPMYNHSSHSAHNDFLGMTAPATHSQPPQPYGMQPQQQARPQQPPQAPRSGGVPMQQAPRSGGVPMQQQQRPMQQQAPQVPGSGNAFDSFTATQTKDQDQGPFGGLNW
jgi:hypothetical protein